MAAGNPFASRRAATAALVAVALLAAGCARREAAAPAAAPATSPTAQKILRVSQRNEPASLDPQLASLPDEYFVARALCEGLVAPDPDGGAPLPGVAERWEASADGMTWTFHLRANARWSNGDPVVAGDFVYSFRRILTPALAAPKAPLLYALRGAETLHRGRAGAGEIGAAAPDPRTLVLTLERPTPHLLALAASGAWLPVHPATVERHGSGRTSRWSDPGNFVGNGPMVLAEYRRGQHLELRRNPLYWDAAAVRVDAVRLVTMDSGDAEERAFRAGQLDVTMAVPATKIPGYAGAEPPVLRRQPLHETRYLSFNCTRGPLADARVRRALALAVDRRGLVEGVLRGGQQPALSLVPPGLGGYRPGVALSGDAAEARRLLAEAGFPEGRGFPRLELSTWTPTPVNEALQAGWKRELGIEVSLLQREGRVHLAAVAAGDYDLSLMPLIPDYDDPSDVFADFTSGAPGNYPHWGDPEYDALVARAGTATDPAERLAAYRAAEARLLEAMPAAPLYFSAQNFLVAPRVRGWRSDRLWNRFYRGLDLAP